MLERELQHSQQETRSDEADESLRGPVKHFSQVQFKPIFWADLAQFRNLVMKNIEVPAFWHLEHEPFGAGQYVPRHQPTPNEQEHKARLFNSVVQVRLRPDQQSGKCPSVFDLAELFQRFGDVNVVMTGERAAYIDLQDPDTSVLD